jgi:hypothetical protein
MMYSGAPDECAYCFAQGRIERHNKCPYAAEEEIMKNDELKEFAESIVRFNLPNTTGNAILKAAAIQYLHQQEKEEP